MLATVFILPAFLEIGFFVVGGILLGFVALAILAPYLWPILLTVFLIIATSSVENGWNVNS